MLLKDKLKEFILE